MHKHKQHK